MRIAIIATGADLAHIPAEAQELTNVWSRAGAEIVLIAGLQATRQALQRAVRPAIDRFWLAAHIGEQGIDLADGVLTIPELAQWIGMSHAGEGVLNGCGSAQHVSTLQRFANVDLAASIHEDLDDEAARITAGYLAQAWIETGSLEEAARRATANGAIEFHFYPAPRRARSMAPPITPDEAQTQPAPADLGAKVDKLIGTIQGDPAWNQPGLIPTLNALRGEFAEFRHADAEYRRQDTAWKDSIEDEIASIKGQRAQTNPRLVALVLLSTLLALIAITMAWMQYTG